MKGKYLIMSGVAVLLLAAILAFGYGMAIAAQANPPAPTPQPPGVPYLSDWQQGPHSQADAEAFKHWDADGEIPTSCAKCHSTTGFQDFLGADGSEAGSVDEAQPIGQVVTCEACHNSAAASLTEVAFPSGVTVTGLGPEARCMECHQGRESKVSVDKKLEDYKATDPDKVPAPIKNADGQDVPMGFTNIHYRAAAASLYGSVVMGGYQYDGKSYDAKNQHVDEADNCVACHNTHSGEVLVEKCEGCHGEQVKGPEDLTKIRELSSAMDYNGNGNTTEGIAEEVSGLQEMLLTTIQNYAKEVGGAEIKYDGATYPYFMGADGKAYPNWTPRLLKAAYNYQFVAKDPGIFAHNPKYAIELLYDSIDDLNAASALKTKTDLSKAAREDAGHFDGASEPFRHWDAEGEVPAGCAKCHSSAGLPFIVNNSDVTVSNSSTNKSLASIDQPIANGFKCTTCHDGENFPERLFIDEVKFPSGMTVWFANADANLCIMCHQGRESKASVDTAIANAGLDKTPDKPAVDADGKPTLSFRNPHYFAAGGSLFGTEVQGMYEYANQKYNGRTQHPDPFNDCTACHDVHTQEVQLDKCATCHGDAAKSVDTMKTWRKTDDTTDYDGDGTPEGYGEEIAGMQEALMAAMQNYATTKKLNAIAYDPNTYPYFFNDTNANGEVDADEAKSANGYATWTAKLLKAAYNYQWVQKDPGAFAHNFYYVDQVLYDSIKDLGASVTKLKRAVVTAPGEPPAAPTPPPTPAP